MYSSLLPITHTRTNKKDAAGENGANKANPNSKRNSQTSHLLSPTFHHLSEQRDTIEVDELLGEGDIPGRVSQVLKSLQLGVHA